VIPPIKENLACRGNYGGSRRLSDIRYIVIHYTGNDGDTDENNGVYFKNNDVDTSAHYFVDDDSVTQSVPDNFIAWHCGTKGTYKHPSCRNSNSIGIEICDDVRNGTIYPSAKTIENVLELTRSLMQKYNIPKEHIIRHFDVTGKKCPAYWVDDAKWKKEFWNRLGEDDLTKEDVLKIIQEYEAQKTKMTVSSWAKTAWDKVKKKGVMDGTKPKSPVTREQLAAILDRLGLL
jgi:N-acetylmuramoyl-L-alanine amidase CwlA